MLGSIPSMHAWQSHSLNTATFNPTHDLSRKLGSTSGVLFYFILSLCSFGSTLDTLVLTVGMLSGLMPSWTLLLGDLKTGNKLGFQIGIKLITWMRLPTIHFQSLAFGQRCEYIWYITVLYGCTGSESSCVCKSMSFVCFLVQVLVCARRLDGAHRVRRCCRALLTAAGNQSTLSVYSTTRRFLNDQPWQACCSPGQNLPTPLNGWPAPISNMLMTQEEAERRRQRWRKESKRRHRGRETKINRKIIKGWGHQQNRCFPLL